MSPVGNAVLDQGVAGVDAGRSDIEQVTEPFVIKSGSASIILDFQSRLQYGAIHTEVSPPSISE